MPGEEGPIELLDEEEEEEEYDEEAPVMYDEHGNQIQGEYVEVQEGEYVEGADAGGESYTLHALPPAMAACEAAKH